MKTLLRTPAAVGLALLLGALWAIPDAAGAAEGSASPTTPLDRSAARSRPRGRTVKRREEPEMPAAEAGVPAAMDIFDFHPPGAKAGSWRQPFDIDVTDGPLRADVRRSSEALKAYHADMAKQAAVGSDKRCGEGAAASPTARCPQRPEKPRPFIVRDPLAVQ